MFTVSSKEAELAAHVASLILDEPRLSTTPLIGRGSVNRVFIVAGAGSKVVVRMSARAGAADEYAKEKWCMEQAAARGVLVPDVLAVGRCGEHAYLVQSYVEGAEGRDRAAMRLDIWRALGEYARRIHAIAVAGFGLKLSDMTEGDARKSWLRYVDYNIRSLVPEDALIELSVLTESQSKVMRESFRRLREREFVFGLNHGDLSLKNTIVRRDGRVVLLDWGSAEASIVPHHDLIELLKMNMLEGTPDDAELRAFLDGYGISPGEFARMLPELELLLTLRAFDKLRWALEWNREELESFVSHARQALDRYLS